MPRPSRYELYYRLIDISFICHLCMMAAFIYKQITGTSAVDGLLYYPFTTVFLVGAFLPPLIVFQRWMRDDFSEMLWQRTAGTVLKALVVLPIPLMLVIPFAMVIQATLGTAPASAATTANSLGLPAMLEGQMVGYMRSMLLLWVTASLLFITAFQWHRWRAGR
jgi:hypothetical protein